MWSSRVYKDTDNVLWIGLLGVLCNGASENSFAWNKPADLVEIAGFWERYTKDGRCAIDVDHQISFASEESR